MQTIMLTSSWRKLLLTLHVAASVSVLGSDLVLLALGIAGLSGADLRITLPASAIVSAWLVAPLAVLALSTGLLLGLLTPWGILRYWWVMIKMMITAVLTGLVLFVLVPRLGAAAAAVTGPDSSLLAGQEPVLFVVAPAIAATLLVVNVALSIFKPGWRLRAHTSATARLQTQPD